MTTGCLPNIPDLNPIDTAIAACLLKSLNEYAIYFKNAKNQQLEIKHHIEYGQLSIAIVAPAPQSSITKAF